MSSFTVQTRQQLHREFNFRCACCLQITFGRGHTAHILNSAHQPGEAQISRGAQLRLVSRNYARTALSNGFLLCQYCHITLLTSYGAVGPVAVFLPCPQIISYLERYFEDHPNTTLTVDQILERLRKNRDLAPLVYPFLDMFKLYLLESPLDNSPIQICTPHLPPQQVLNPTNSGFVPAPANTLDHKYRIYSATTLPAVAPYLSGLIALSPDIPEFNEQMWKIPRSAGAFLTLALSSCFTQLGLSGISQDLGKVYRLLNTLMPASRRETDSTPLPALLPTITEGRREEDLFALEPIQSLPSQLSYCNQLSFPDLLVDVGNIDLFIGDFQAWLHGEREIDSTPLPVLLPAISDERREEDFLAPEPTRSPRLPETEEDRETWQFGPNTSANNVIWLSGGKYESTPWLRLKKYARNEPSIIGGDDTSTVAQSQIDAAHGTDGDYLSG